MHATRRPLSLAVQVASLLSAALVPAAPALAEPAPRNPAFTARGAVSPVHPLPLWYQDAGGVQVEPCLDATTTAPANPCQLLAGGGVGGAAFDPALPITFPTNFPPLVHYMWANTEVSFLGNNRALVYIAELSGSVAAPPPAAGSGTVFTHLRFDTNEPLTPLVTYTITHPYGTFTLAVDDRGDLCPANNKACDISFPTNPTAGDFNAVLGANLSVLQNDATVGSFLVDVGAPPGFLGDGASRVQVTGSPKGTNFVRIQGPATGLGSTDLGGSTCAAGTIPNCAESILFTVIGRRFAPAGGPTTRFAVSGPAAPELEAGVAQSFTVTATDVNGNTTTGYTGIVRFTSSDPQAGLPGDATLVNGVGTFQVTPRTVGTFTLTARDTVRTTVTGSASKQVIAGPAVALVEVSGGGQVAGVSAALAQPLVVRAVDAFGNPKGGVSVTFTPPAGGAVSPGVTLTDLATGLASTAATLGPAVGSQAFTASSGVLTPVTFTATAAVPGLPVTLTVTGLPATTTAGAAAAFTVTARDAFGDVATLATGAAGALTITSTDPAATVPQAAQLTLGTAALAATFRTAGLRTLTATLTATPSATATADTLVGAGPPTTLEAVSGGGQTGTVGQVLAAPLVIQARDAFGNPAPGATVTWTVPVGGVATLDGLTTGPDGRQSAQARLGEVAGLQAFQATLPGVPASAVTFVATASPGPAASLTVGGLAGTTTAGVPAPFTVTVRDTFGNVATGFAGTVGFASTDGAATLPAAAGLTAGAGSFSATFRTAGARTLTATQVGVPAVTGSAATTVVAAAAASLAAVSGDGQGGTVGQPLAAPFVVRAVDAFSNPVAGVTVTFAPPAGGSVAPASAVTGLDGRASATGTLAGTVGAQAFSAAAAGLAGSPIAFGASAAPGPASVLALTGLPAGVTAGLDGTFTVTARDTFGNVATGFAGTVGFTSTDGAATLPGPSALASGAGTFPVTFRTAGARTLTATVTGAPGVTGSAATTVAPAAPAAITLTGAPATTPAGLSFVVTVDLRDAFGNAPADERVAFTSTDPGAVLPLAPALLQGSGTFEVTLVTAGAQGLTVASVAAPAVTASASVTVSAGAPSALVAVSGDGQAGLVGAPLGAPFVVRVTDLFGNPRSGVPVTFSAPATGGVAPATVQTSADGTAAALGTLGQAAGAQVFTAASPGLTGSPVAFSATASPGPIASLSLAGLPAAVAAGAVSNVVVTARDAFGNQATGFSGSVVFTSNDPAAVLPSGVALAAGTGTFPVVLKTVGDRTVTVQAPGAGLTASGTVSVGPAAAATLALVGTPGTSAGVGTAASGQVTVLVKDTLGNPVPGFTVAFTALDGGGISPGSGTTDASGQTSATVTVGTTTGPYRFSATAAGLAGSPATFTVTATPGAGAFLALERQAAGTQLDCGCYDLTARLQDQYGNAVVQGLPGVTIAAAGQARVTATELAGAVVPAATVTGALKADGTATVRVCDDAPETAAVAISAAAKTGASLDLTWLLGPADAAASVFQSDAAVLTAYAGRAVVSITPRSACGNPVEPTGAVVVGLNGPGSVTPTSLVAAGRWAATVSIAPCPGTPTTQVTGRIGTLVLPPFDLAVTCLAPSSAETSLTLSRAAVVVCDDAAQDAVTVTVTPRDDTGAAMGPGHAVTLALPGFTGGPAADAGDGTYAATFTASGCAQPTRTVEVTVNGVALAPAGAALEVTCAPVDGSASGISVAGGPGVANGTSQLEVTVAAVNTCGVPARGRAVQLATTLGTLGAPTGTTDAAGTHLSWLTSAQAGTASLTATVDGVPVSAGSVTFNAPPGGGGGGCSSGGGAGLPALVLLGLATLRRAVRRREG
jgi:Big-like domain-containing protein